MAAMRARTSPTRASQPDSSPSSSPRRTPRGPPRFPAEAPVDFLLPRRQIDGGRLDGSPAFLDGARELGHLPLVGRDAPLPFLDHGQSSLVRLPHPREKRLPGPELLVEPRPLDLRGVEPRPNLLHAVPPLL